MKARKRDFRFPDWPRWMDVKTAAAYTCFSESKIYEMIAEGILPVTRPPQKNGRPGHPRIDRHDIDRLMMAHRLDVNEQIQKLLKNLEA